MKSIQLKNFKNSSTHFVEQVKCTLDLGEDLASLLKLGDAHVTPRNIQEVQASKLGDSPRHPFLIDKYQVTFQDTIFLLLHILCVFLGASLFLLSVFFCFVCCNKWLDHIMFVLERDTLAFTLIVLQVFSFSSTAFSFCFSP
jgi:hypothetical protein